MRPACRNINQTVIKVTAQITRLESVCSRITSVRLRAAWSVNIWWFNLIQNNIARISRLSVFENLKYLWEKMIIIFKNRIIRTYKKAILFPWAQWCFRVSGCLLSLVTSAADYVYICTDVYVCTRAWHRWNTWSTDALRGIGWFAWDIMREDNTPRAIPTFTPTRFDVGLFLVVAARFIFCT